MSDNKKKSTHSWMQDLQYRGLIICDPDGWDRKNLEVSMSEPITREEFERRVRLSTISLKLDKSLEVAEFTD
jgi:hypothetical protein